MACPICGANCRCRKRGPSGLCCSCHKHKARPIRVDFELKLGSDNYELEKASLNRHRAAISASAKTQAA